MPKEVWVYGNGLSKPVNGTRYEYNAQLQVSKEISPEGYVKEYEYDKFNNITQVRNYGTGSIPAISIAEYDLLGRKTAEYSPNFADKSKGTTSTYYPSGTVKTMTDAMGNVTSYKYNAYLNMTEKTNPDGTINIVEYDGLQREKATYFKSSENGIKQILTTTSYEFVKNQSFNVYKSLEILADNIQSCSGLRITKTSYITAEKQVVTETFADFRGNTVEEKLMLKLSEQVLIMQMDSLQEPLMH